MDSASNVDAFIEKAKPYTGIRELTPEILRLFISRIEIGEKSEKYSRTAEQASELFIGMSGLWTAYSQTQPKQRKNKLHKTEARRTAFAVCLVLNSSPQSVPLNEDRMVTRFFYVWTYGFSNFYLFLLIWAKTLHLNKVNTGRTPDLTAFLLCSADINLDIRHMDRDHRS